jgi:hypothetical protein
VVAGLAFIVSLTASVAADREALTVRRAFRSRRVRWPDVASVSCRLGTPGQGEPKLRLRVDLRCGGPVRVDLNGLSQRRAQRAQDVLVGFAAARGVSASIF